MQRLSAFFPYSSYSPASSMLLSTFLTLLLAAFAAASPSPFGKRDANCAKKPFLAVQKPPGGQQWNVPQTGLPAYAMLGVGTQNYTCASDGKTYTAAGAIAKLYDMTCLSEGNYTTVVSQVYADNAAITNFKLEQEGNHYFVLNGATLAPRWDFGASYVVGTKTSDFPAPDPNNVDYLELNVTSGSLSSPVGYIFRTDTNGGQAPKTPCTPGNDYHSSYVARYHFY